MNALIVVTSLSLGLFLSRPGHAVKPHERTIVACGKVFSVAINEPVISCQTVDGTQEFATEKTPNRAPLITRLQERVCRSSREMLDITCRFGFPDKDSKLAELYTYSLKGLDKVTLEAFQQAWDQWITTARVRVQVDATMPANGSDGIKVSKNHYRHTSITLPRESTNHLKAVELATKYFAEIGVKILGVKNPDEAIKKYGAPAGLGKGVEVVPLPDDAPEWLKSLSLLP